MSLKELYVSNCNLKNIDFLHSQTGLQKLDISENPINDLSPLEIWRGNDLTELSVLSDEAANSYAELNISGIDLGKIEKSKGLWIKKC